MRKTKAIKVNRPSFAKALPITVIYKTKANYSRLVPIGLSDDKSQIVSYPHPKDVVIDSSIVYPVSLGENYWLDKIGIGANVAYLGVGLKEYAELNEPLSMETMMSLIIEKDPLIKLCDCGPRLNDINITVLKDLIKNKNLNEKCKTILDYENK
jgi:hypothetical protein